MSNKGEVKALKIAKDSLSYKEGRYEETIAWKDDKNLDVNYAMALNRLTNTEKRLLKDKELGHQYSKVINDYKDVEEVKRSDKEEGWYLPHFPVLRPDKATTKLRVVFGGAAKFKGRSLNDAIHQGPKLQQDFG